jgi:hypothetical protein
MDHGEHTGSPGDDDLDGGDVDELHLFRLNFGRGANHSVVRAAFGKWLQVVERGHRRPSGRSEGSI